LPTSHRSGARPCGFEYHLHGLLALPIFFLTACSGPYDSVVTGNLVEPEVIEAEVEVEVMALQLRPWRQRINTYGRIVSAEKVVIGVEIAGTIASVHFHEGQQIKVGQTLVLMDARKQKLRLERANANVATARIEREKAHGTYRRQQTLLGRQVIAEETYQQSEANYHAARARLEQAKAAQKLAQQELEDLTLISPVDGTVESESIEPGQRVRPGDTLALIQTTDSLQVITYVRENEVNLLRLGDVAPVQSPGVPGRTYQARIESVGNTADPRTGNFPVKLRIDNADALLREGMSAQVELHSRQDEQRLAIPSGAVTDRDRQHVVFVERDERAVRITPALGMEVDGWVPVVSGLAAGDRLIINQLALLADNNRVRAIVETSQAETLSLK
jgi:RND family efflux transporter MFP subunit